MRRRLVRQLLPAAEPLGGLAGYSPGAAGPDARAAIASIASSSGSGLIGKDPLAIRVHFRNMLYAGSQRERHIRVCSGFPCPDVKHDCCRERDLLPKARGLWLMGDVAIKA